MASWQIFARTCRASAWRVPPCSSRSPVAIALPRRSSTATRFEFTPFARLVFSANRLTGSDDASQAFFDRWLIVPFPNRFRQTRWEAPRHVLQARLCAPSELSGALNKALDAWSEHGSAAGLQNQERVARSSGNARRPTTRSRSGWSARELIQSLASRRNM